MPIYPMEGHDVPQTTRKQSSGCLFFCPNTQRFMLGLRSHTVDDPNVWGTFGGGLEHGESIESALRREIAEEAGYIGQLIAKPLLRHQNGMHTYHNHLGVVPNEFVPELNHETATYLWFRLEDTPSPLHFGVQDLLDDSQSMTIIRDHIGKLTWPK